MPEPTPMSVRAARIGRLVALLGAVGLGLFALIAALIWLGDLADIAKATVKGGLVPSAAGLLAVILGLVGLAVVARLATGTGSRLRLAIVLGLVVLVVLRIAIAASYDGVPDGEVADYDRLARAVLDGHCCFDDRPMGYPIVLSLVYRVVGAGHPAVELLNIACAIATGALLFLIARRFLGAPAAAVALYLYAIWPAGALMIVTSLPHTSYELLVVAAAWAAIATRDGWRGSALAGVILGVSQYLRPTSPLLLPVLLLARLWPGMPWRRAITGLLVPMAGFFVLVLVPVLAHNQADHGQLSLSTSSYGGHSLWVGTDVRSGGRLTDQNSAEVLAMPGADLWQKSDAAGARAIERMKADPVGIGLLALRKQVTLWGTERYGVQYGIRRELAENVAHKASVLPSLASGTFWVLLLIAAAAGLALRRHRPDRLLILTVLLVAAVSFLHGFTEVRDRYHSYAVPLLLPFAAVAILALLARMGLVPAGVSGEGEEPTAPLPTAPDPTDSVTAARPASDGWPGWRLPRPSIPSYFRHPGPAPASATPGSQ
ncbi:MAG: glycosyltransferase family 39 protein [Chloroflexota bacterium]